MLRPLDTSTVQPPLTNNGSTEMTVPAKTDCPPTEYKFIDFASSPIVFTPYEEPNDLELTIYRKRGIPARYNDPTQMNTPDILSEERIESRRVVPQSNQETPKMVSSPRSSITELIGKQGYGINGGDISNIIAQIYPQIEAVVNSNTQGGNSSVIWANAFNRLSTYLHLSPISQNMMNLIYGNVIEYIKRPAGTGSPLEEYIISFDEVMIDEGLVRAVGARMGIFIPITPDYWAREIFIDRMVEVIENLNLFEPDTTKMPYGHRISFTLQEVIDMDRPQFKEWMEKIGSEFTEIGYQDRLLVYINSRKQTG